MTPPPSAATACPVSSGRSSSSSSSSSETERPSSSQTTRQDDLLQFLEITPESQQRIRQLFPQLRDQVPTILDEFYTTLRQYPQTARLINSQAMEERLKMAQRDHWETLFQARFDTDYIQRVTRIGQAHHRIDLQMNWFIGAYHFVLKRLVTEVCHQESGNPETATRLSDNIGALTQAVFFDLVLIMEHYNMAVAQAARRQLQLEIERIHGSTQSICRASEETSQAVTTVAASVEELSNSLREISEQAVRAADLASKGRHATQDNQSRMNALTESTEAITQVVDWIQTIAERTNLLALNATIQASKAGHMGRGFQVVANEVKQLAIQAADSAQSIHSQVDDIYQQLQAALASFSHINALVENVDAFTATLAQTLDQQNLATQEITQTMTRVSAAVQQVQSSIMDVNESAEALVRT